MNTVVYIRSSGVFDDSRATKEIKCLAENGSNVVVIGWNRHGDAEKECKKLFTSSKISFVFYNESISSGQGIRNIFSMIRWSLFVIKTLKKIKKINVIHACDFDGGFGAKLYAKRHKIKFVYDIYDYYADSHNLPQMLLRVISKLENAIISFADVTIICTEERIEQIKDAKYKRVEVIYNSPSVIGLNETDIVYDYVYCGYLGDGRLIEEVLNKFDQNNDLKFCIAGSGKYSTKCTELMGQYSEFEYHGSISYDEVLRYEQSSRVISAIYIPTIRNHRLCAPNKFYEAMALGKPVIVCKGTGIDKIVEKYNIGRVINYDVQEFYEAIRFFKLNSCLCEEMGKRAHTLYTNSYSWDLMQDKIKGIYDELISM